MKKTQGFTLVELMISVAVLGILTIIGSTLYSSYVRKGRRIDGINAILAVSLAEERYRANNTTYGTLVQVGSAATSPDGYYSIAVSNVAATTYTITATAQGTQANDKSGSTSCTTLTLAQSSGTITKTPAVCWPV